MKRAAVLLVVISFIIGSVTFPSSTAAQAPGNTQGRPRGRPIVLGPDDKPAFDDPPADFNVKRDDIPHGKTEMIEYVKYAQQVASTDSLIGSAQHTIEGLEALQV